jgi:hypothetical protein
MAGSMVRNDRAKLSEETAKDSLTVSKWYEEISRCLAGKHCRYISSKVLQDALGIKRQTMFTSRRRQGDL